MARQYKAKNRYCRRTKLSEDEFEALVQCWFEGRSAEAAARQIGRTARTVRPLYSRLRKRIMVDETLTGWMGGGAGRLPDEADSIWSAIYDCLIDCPAYQDERTYRSPEYVEDYRGYTSRDGHTQRTLSFVRQIRKTECQRCPIKLDFEFYNEVAAEIGRHTLRTAGIPRETFKEHYFEIMLRVNLEFRSTKFEQPGDHIDAGKILHSLEVDPL